MRIRIDRARCQGHARCWSESAELYPLDDEGFTAISEAGVPEHLRDDARRGAAACPERAISIDEDVAG